jgi:hypothetical protein
MNVRMKVGSKGQVSVDYLIAVIILGFVAIGVFMAFEGNERHALESMRTIKMKGIADSFSHTVNSVALMGEGSQRTVLLPSTTDSGSEYNLTIRGNAVLIRWKDKDYASRFVTSELNSSELNLTPGTITMWNSQGKIFIADEEMMRSLRRAELQ